MAVSLHLSSHHVQILHIISCMRILGHLTPRYPSYYYAPGSPSPSLPNLAIRKHPPAVTTCSRSPPPRPEAIHPQPHLPAPIRIPMPEPNPNPIYPRPRRSGLALSAFSASRIGESQLAQRGVLKPPSPPSQSSSFSEITHRARRREQFTPAYPDGEPGN